MATVELGAVTTSVQYEQCIVLAIDLFDEAYTGCLDRLVGNNA